MCKSAKNNPGIAALGGEHRYLVVHHCLPQLRPCLNRWVAFLANPILKKTPHRKIPPQSFLQPLCFHLDSCQRLSKQERKIKLQHDFCCFPTAFQGIDVLFQAAQKCQRAGGKGQGYRGHSSQQCQKHGPTCLRLPRKEPLKEKALKNPVRTRNGIES